MVADVLAVTLAVVISGHLDELRHGHAGVRHVLEEPIQCADGASSHHYVVVEEHEVLALAEAAGLRHDGRVPHAQVLPVELDAHAK